MSGVGVVVGWKDGDDVEGWVREDGVVDGGDCVGRIILDEVGEGHSRHWVLDEDQRPRCG